MLTLQHLSRLIPYLAITAITIATSSPILEGLPEVDCSKVTSADSDAFLRLVTQLETEGITHNMDTDLKVVPYEILTAAAIGNLQGMLDNLGHIRLLRVLNGVTEKYSNDFTRYLIAHLDAEHCAKSTGGKL
ncbi:hypothetical protein V1264_020734 [Littorina saxatilis]|uniref:Uncharacterized protein n=1 Tax=Littorina saxatilis TaxID=31220 RepID=A0AAN9BCG2_9CAEN